MNIDEVSTPALVLNIDALKRNIARMASECAEGHVALRPHTKGHKSPWIASLQLEAGAVGICTAKLSEAAVMVHAGIKNVLVTTELTPPKFDRFLSLATLAELTAVVDDSDVVASLGRRAVEGGMEIPVLVEVNVGQERTGVDPGQPAVSLAQLCARTRGIRFAGLQGYEGHLQHIYEAPKRRQLVHEALERLFATRTAIESSGLPVDWVTTAGTGTYRYAIEHGSTTEVQPGSYVVMDSNYARVADLPFENALFIIGGVVSVNRMDHVVIDAGWKCLSTEDGMPVVRDSVEAAYEPAGDEHGRIKGLHKPCRPGEHIWIIPSHCDTTINLHNQYVLFRDNGHVEGELAIVGRGQLT
jgi:D-serine deaminase-like pyridoxal phosphate-dependent protein